MAYSTYKLFLCHISSVFDGVVMRWNPDYDKARQRSATASIQGLKPSATAAVSSPGVQLGMQHPTFTWLLEYVHSVAVPSRPLLLV